MHTNKRTRTRTRTRTRDHHGGILCLAGRAQHGTAKTGFTLVNGDETSKAAIIKADQTAANSNGMYHNLDTVGTSARIIIIIIFSQLRSDLWKVLCLT